MTNRAVIRLNDTTDHGGKVVTAIDDCVYQGVPESGKTESREKYRDYLQVMDNLLKRRN
ncbi:MULTISPECIES: hypothetical protein [unclassified Photorhabdus]|uniref:hypothetical protein n=1 Tax=unclassified Photorhabdus TaxID=2620880 RepID=UPI001EFC3276|nr:MULTISPECIES: hypothetical protein [unclassified Photorhabdus]